MNLRAGGDKLIKITVVGPTDRLNRGTEALILSRVKIMDQFFNRPYFFVQYASNLASIPKQFISNPKIEPYKKTALILPAFVSLNTPMILISALLWRILSNFVKADFLLSWNEELNAVKSSDIVVTTGGDVLSEDYGLFSFLIHFFALFLSILLKKPFIVFAESVGPFKSSITASIAKFILSKAALITVRDEISLNHIDKLGVKGPVYLTADSAFLLDKKDVRNPLMDDFMENDNLIGFSISNAIAEWGGGSYDEYIELITEVIDTIIENYEANVILIAHVTIDGLNDDRLINQRVFDGLRNKKRVFNLNEDYSSEELKGTISKCDLFVGARMHANIAALSTCVPVVAISYSIKTPGLMKLCGLEDYYIEFKDLTEDQLISKISEAWENRDDIKKHLEKVIPGIKRKALRNGELVRELCDSLGIT